MTYLRAGEGMRNASFLLDVNQANASWKLALRMQVRDSFEGTDFSDKLYTHKLISRVFAYLLGKKTFNFA